MWYRESNDNRENNNRDKLQKYTTEGKGGENIIITMMNITTRLTSWWKTENMWMNFKRNQEKS